MRKRQRMSSGHLLSFAASWRRCTVYAFLILNGSCSYQGFIWSFKAWIHESSLKSRFSLLQQFCSSIEHYNDTTYFPYSSFHCSDLMGICARVCFKLTGPMHSRESWCCGIQSKPKAASENSEMARRILLQQKTCHCAPIATRVTDIVRVDLRSLWERKDHEKNTIGHGPKVPWGIMRTC